jgi:hypothetical protein
MLIKYKTVEFSVELAVPDVFCDALLDRIARYFYAAESEQDKRWAFEAARVAKVRKA